MVRLFRFLALSDMYQLLRCCRTWHCRSSSSRASFSFWMRPFMISFFSLRGPRRSATGVSFSTSSQRSCISVLPRSTSALFDTLDSIAAALRGESRAGVAQRGVEAVAQNARSLFPGLGPKTTEFEGRISLRRATKRAARNKSKSTLVFR